MAIEHFRIFLTVIDQGSFARAADELGRTEGAVSKRIKKLEEELGVHLFDRRTKPPMPTSQALDLASSMRDALRSYHQVHSQAKQLAGCVEGEIRLGVIPTISEGILAPALRHLRDGYPQLRVHIENGLSGDLLERLTHGRLDAAIVTKPPHHAASLIYDRIASEPIILIVSTGLQSSTVPALLREQPIIRFNRAAGVGRIIDGLLTELAPGKSALIELDSIQSIIQMVAYGLGVALIPKPSIARAAAHRRLLTGVSERSLNRKDAIREVAFAREANRADDQLTGAVLDSFRDVLATPGFV